ncbi:hypothetical protein JW968_04385 [Candidatus Woesearchaeota archaeon]|nr:hypothetical protein [Candidatus Woesearchaeota archaeon]
MYRYKAGKTIFHRLSIEYKLSYMTALLVLVFLTADWVLLTLLMLLHLALLKLSGYRGIIKLAALIFAFLIIPVGLLYAFIRPDLIIVYNMTARVYVMLSFGALFTTTTDNLQLLALLRRLRVPEPIYIPMYIMLRFLPELEMDYKEIREMQKIKRIRFSLKPGPLKIFMRSLFVPLITIIIERSREIAVILYLKRERKRDTD